ncbi:MAG TPA: carbon-nitrogen hydrolase family protein, partial [Planctomycetota bacterium]|nr:carbon-nitrogen hydrolase family protein [Planctomycetota bacterium]
MRIALAQTRPVRGDIAANLAAHHTLLDRALERDARLVVFPELSITGYEPRLARELAMEVNDPRLDPLQRTSDASGATIAVGVPIRTPDKPHIALVLFEPHAPRRFYAKQWLHADELPFFSPGDGSNRMLGEKPRIALAICYELSVPDHAAASVAAGAQVYLASAAKSATGVAQAHARLAAVAREHRMPALLVNGVGPAEDFVGAGGTVAFDARGEVVA